MKVFICINDLSEFNKGTYDPKEIITKKAMSNEVSGIFFYSNSVNDLVEKNKFSLWLSFTKEMNIPIYSCMNSLSKRNLINKINPIVKVTGLGQLIQGVLSNDKTLVIGDI